MSATKDVTLWCDSPLGCSAWWGTEPTVAEARKLAQREGWVWRGGKDLCPHHAAPGRPYTETNGDLRVITKRPNLGWDEVAWKIEVTIPSTWGRVLTDTLALSMPEPPEGSVRIVEELGAVGEPS